MGNPSENAIERLFALLNHELRTPITTLQGAIALLRTNQIQDPSEVEALLALAADSTDRLDHLIQNILDWYDVTQGSSRLLRQRCNLALLMQEVVASLLPFTSQQQVQVHLQTPRWVPIEADPYYISRTLSHLLHNAIKFSKSGCNTRVVVERIASGESCDPERLSHVQIAIQDQGMGIPEAALKEIFRPFHQIDSSDARLYGGLGLELAICLEVIRRHQGKIWVESRVGEGTCFFIVLPTCNPEDLTSTNEPQKPDKLYILP